MKLTKKMQVNSVELRIIVLCISLVVSILIFPGVISTIFSLVGVAILLVLSISNSLNSSGSKSLLLIFPIFVSSLQNIYLGISISKQTSFSLQILLSLHFVFILGFFILNIKKIQKFDYIILINILLLIVYAILLFVVYPTNVIAFFSSFRNVLSGMLFFVFAIVLSKDCSEQNFYRYINGISWFVIMFGFLEHFGGLRIWKALGITELWALKGIPTNIAGIPPNWYSSEIIGGNICLREVSSFADPVNLGTFLFAIFVIMWYQKKRLLMILTLISIVLTVSKGAFLGILIFILIYALLNNKLKFFVPIVGMGVLLLGIYFVKFSASSSSGSLFAHVRGFLNSFSVLATNPLGLGIGNVGVLAGLFNTELSNTSVSETGVGMIIAQLGLPGVIFFACFFIRLASYGKKTLGKNTRKKIAYFSLLIAFLANVMFNEVALSPNSCGVYFIYIAFLLNSIQEEA